MSASPRYGFHPPRVTRLQFALPGLDRTHRIAHLTDLHFAASTPLQIHRDAVAVVNAAKPDLVVLTGDFVGYHASRLDGMEEVLSGIEARTVAVLGNHDHWTDATVVCGTLARCGIDVLINEWMVADGLCVVGLDDGVTGHHDVARAVAHRPPLPALGLSHDPEKAPDLWAAGVPIVLSGHTHAGQVRIGELTDGLQRAVLGRRYCAGLYEEPAGRVYVNAGVGATGFPWRIGAAAHREVAILDLVPG
jgi:predicted MPP superfamily phosphohydrolase